MGKTFRRNDKFKNKKDKNFKKSKKFKEFQHGSHPHQPSTVQVDNDYESMDDIS